jgi:hypothetical protein
MKNSEQLIATLKKISDNLNLFTKIQQETTAVVQLLLDKGIITREEIQQTFEAIRSKQAANTENSQKPSI